MPVDFHQGLIQVDHHQLEAVGREQSLHCPAGACQLKLRLRPRPRVYHNVLLIQVFYSISCHALAPTWADCGKGLYCLSMVTQLYRAQIHMS